jgi:hypothetical protein
MLKWHKRDKGRPKKGEYVRVPSIAFIDEQDGDAERSLKFQLVERFRLNLVLREAYLVRVRYGTSQDIKVALCLDTGGKAETGLLQVAASEFAKIFGSHESLDILFLSPEEQKKISAVAKPFYSPSLYRA